jgi:hypothetical protein
MRARRSACPREPPYAAAALADRAALHRTDRTSCRPPLARCALSAFVGLLAGLPHMPM